MDLKNIGLGASAGMLCSAIFVMWILFLLLRRMK